MDERQKLIEELIKLRTSHGGLYITDELADFILERQKRLNKIEIWRDVVGYEGLYQVSSEGNVVNKRGQYIKPYMTRRYLRIGLTKNNIRRSQGLHHIVMQAFLGECPTDYERNHKNGIKTDNSLINLEYITRKGNMRHAFANGFNPIARLNRQSVLRIRELHAKGIDYENIARIFNVTKNTVGMVIRKETWSYIKA